MKLDWKPFVGKTLNITMDENYGLMNDPKSDTTIFEIVFKAGKLIGAYDDGLLLETEREKEKVQIFVPHQSIKCVEIFNF
jgi:predicted nucleic acid-binding protein